MSGMFRRSKFKGDISDWDVSNVIDMDRMFEASKHLYSDISNWNVSNVISMRFMLAECSLTIKLESDLNKWSVNKALCVHHMFYESTDKRPKWYYSVQNNPDCRM